jgi:hypothetical protein
MLGNSKRSGGVIMAIGKVLSLLVLVLLPACAMVPMGYSKPNSTQPDFLQARYECMKDATFVHTRTGVVSGNLYSEQQLNCDLFKACMQARGFDRVPNGPFPVKVSFGGRTACI